MDYGIYNACLHPDAAGHRQMLMIVERLIDHMRHHDGVRFTTLDEVNREYRAKQTVPACRGSQFIACRQRSSMAACVSPCTMKSMRERLSSSGQRARCTGGCTMCRTRLMTTGAATPATFSRPFTRSTLSP